jgi:hypothetical protein
MPQPEPKAPMPFVFQIFLLFILSVLTIAGIYYAIWYFY